MKQSGFNPKARWDRHIPETEKSTPEDLSQKIDCLAWFKGGKILPQEFTWNNKTYRIRKITYNWQERHGTETINNFSVSTGLNLYQISFNNKTYGWRIDKVIE